MGSRKIKISCLTEHYGDLLNLDEKVAAHHRVVIGSLWIGFVILGRGIFDSPSRFGESWRWFAPASSQTQLTCHFSKRPTQGGRYYRYKNGWIVCESCERRLPKCEACGLPIDRL